MKVINQLEVANRRVLIRADLNVPLNEKLEITDDNRIRQFLPTLKHVIEKGGRAIVMSHLGEGSAKGEGVVKVDPNTSLKPAADRLHELLGTPVKLAPDCVGPEVEQMVEQLAPGETLVLENLRFHAGEKENNQEFAQKLARLGDIFVGDAFATCHRSHASMVSVPKLFKERAAGFLVQKEIEFHDKTMLNPKRPLCFVLGGSKVSTKLKVLINIASKADKLVIGGAMSNTFLAAQGLQVGRSLVEHELIPQALELLGTLARRGCKVYLPVDVMVGPNLNAKGLARAVPVQEIPADMMALDIGPATSKLYAEALVDCETIVWNGPMGAYENSDYAQGTTDMIETLASAHGLTVVGGGDTDAAIHDMELAHKFGFISTAGGAFLAMLEGNTLPGIAALE